jgi:predicted dehydrogenase
VVNKKPKIGVVGCGSWSTEMHLPAMLQLAEQGLVEYTAVCDLNEEAAQVYADKLGVKAVYADMEKMIKECTLDGLDIITTPDIERTPVDIAIEHRVPFLVEKPPAPSSAHHKRYMESVGDLLHVVGYNRRHSPFMIQAKEWMEGEQLQAVQVSFSRYRRMSDDFTGTAVHALDTARFLAGGDLGKTRLEVVWTDEVFNFYLNGWVGDTRVDVQITPNIALSEERYTMKSVDKTVVISFPQPGCYDQQGSAELYERNKRTAIMTGAEFGDSRVNPLARRPYLGGIEGEHEVFYKALAGQAEPWSTLSATYQTQVIREQLSEMRNEAPCVKDIDYGEQ